MSQNCKYILVFSLLLLMRFGAIAQEALPDRYGIFYVYNNSAHYDESMDIPFDSSPGVKEVLQSSGVTIFYESRLNRRFALRTEMSYLDKGFLYFTNANDFGKVNFHTLDFAHLINWSVLPKKRMTPYVIAGLNIGYVFAHKIDPDIEKFQWLGPGPERHTFVEYIGYKKINGDYSIGIGLRYDDSIFLEIIRKRDIKPFVDESWAVIRTDMFLFKIGIGLQDVIKKMK